MGDLSACCLEGEVANQISKTKVECRKDQCPASKKSVMNICTCPEGDFTSFDDGACCKEGEVNQMGTCKDACDANFAKVPFKYYVIKRVGEWVGWAK